MNVGILGMGEWLPSTTRGNDHWPEEVARSFAARLGEDFTSISTSSDGDEIDRLVAMHAQSDAHDPFLGTKARRVAEESMTAHEAESLAARAALDDAGIEGGAIDVVLSSSAVPDRLTPPSAVHVAYRIGARDARAIGLDAVCASAIVGLDMAVALVSSGRAKHVLLTQSHLMTRAFPLQHPASPNVGDAATALVVGATKRTGIRAVHAISNGEYFDAVVWRRPKEADTPWWLPGGAMAMGSYDSAAARALVRDTVRIGAGTLREIMSKAEVRATDIDLFVSVQPRKWIPLCIAEGSGLSKNKTVETFDARAHLGACGPIVNLLEARRTGRLAPGARVAMYAQGAGLTRAAAIFEW